MVKNKEQFPICTNLEIARSHQELQNKIKKMMDYNYRKYYIVHFKLKNKNHSINSKKKSEIHFWIKKKDHLSVNSV